MKIAKEDENAGYATAVAAAAYAIKSNQESSTDDDDGRRGIRQEKNISIRSATLNNKSTTIKPAPEKDLERGENAKSIQRKPTLADHMTGSRRTPSIKPAPERQASAQETPPNRQSSLPQTTTIPKTTVGAETKADIWEREEMKKIEERYNERISTTEKWKNKEKEKSNNKLMKIEKKLDARKAKAKEDHNKKIREIEDFSKKGTDWAKKKKEDEERKARDKAEKYRTTGKAPSTFWCF